MHPQPIDTNLNALKSDQAKTMVLHQKNWEQVFVEGKLVAEGKMTARKILRALKIKFTMGNLAPIGNNAKSKKVDQVNIEELTTTSDDLDTDALRMADLILATALVGIDGECDYCGCLVASEGHTDGCVTHTAQRVHRTLSPDYLL